MSEKSSIETEIYKNGWEHIGFHRQIGGFFYNYVPVILVGVVLLLGTGVLIPMILPFPDAKGFAEIAKSMYALMFLLFDAGIGSAIGKFVPEYRVKDPKRALQYLSFFIWFQMFTGLIQITLIAFYVYFFLPPSMSHLAWIYLIYSTIQFPGMFGIMRTALKSFQHYAKYMLTAFLADVTQLIFEIFFILMGRWLGSLDPRVGSLMGTSIGLVIGLYVNDFLSFLISTYLLKIVLRDIGLNISMCLRPNFTKEIAKESLLYGLKTMPAAIYGNILGFFGFLITFNNLPQYAGWLGLMNLAKTFTKQIDLAGGIKSDTEYAISESYNNGKIRLSQFYMALSLKWRFMLTTFFGVSIVILIPLALMNMLDIFGKNWLPALALIPLMSIQEFIKIFEPPCSFTKLNHPGIDQIIGLISSTASFLWYLYIIYGIGANLTIEIFILKDIPIQLLVIILQWTILNKMIMKVNLRNFIMQSFILPIPGIIIYAIFCVLYGKYIFSWGVGILGAIPFAVISIIMMLILWPSIIFCPLMALFGAWDKYNIDVFLKAIEISGPSKFMMKMLYKASYFVYKRSPLKDKYPIKGAEDAIKEAKDLENIKKKEDIKNME